MALYLPAGLCTITYQMDYGLILTSWIKPPYLIAGLHPLIYQLGYGPLYTSWVMAPYIPAGLWPLIYQLGYGPLLTSWVRRLVMSVSALFCSNKCSASSVSLLEPSPPAFLA